MRVTKVTKIYRPMRRFGNLLKDIFAPEKSNHFWIRVKETAVSKEKKEHHIAAVIELLDNRIKIEN
jgi:hypothetical protein